jgi:hypothetical protein
MRIPQALRACILFLSPLLALGQQTPESAPPPASIIGTVTDIQNAAIPAATVVISGPNPDDRVAITSDGNGFFAFRNLRPDVSYSVTISAKGFADWTSLPIILTPGQQLDLASIKLKIAVVQTTVTALSSEQIATQQVKIAEQQRVLGIFPNFYVIYSHNPAPLTTKLKYKLAFRTVIDPVNFAASAFFAALDQAGDAPNYPQGAKGYAERFGADYADGFTDIMIGGAVLPSLFHQDPRYFYQGTGTIKSRIRHAVASPFVCKGDNGRNQFNISSIGGDLASGALSNLYYPPSNRGPGLVFEGTLITTGGRVVDALVQEFIFRHLTPSAKKQHN